MSKTERAFGLLVRLMFASRALAWQALHSRTRAPAPACPWCQTTQRPQAESESSWLPGRHAAGCPLGGVTQALSDIEHTMSIRSVAELAAIDAEHAAGADAPWPPPEDEPALALGRKPPARAGIDDAEAPRLMAGLVDFGEPWRVSSDNPSEVIDRGGEIMHDAFGTSLTEEEDPEYARRVAAAINLCSGASTEALEQAFDEIASTTPRWALMAIDIQNLGAGHIGAIRDFIDQIVRDAAQPAPAGSRPQ